MIQDVVIVGGGVIGLSIAYRLARDGVRALVLDRRVVGREASWAGAGLIPAHAERLTGKNASVAVQVMVSARSTPNGPQLFERRRGSTTASAGPEASMSHSPRRRRRIFAQLSGAGGSKRSSTNGSSHATSHASSRRSSLVGLRRRCTSSPTARRSVIRGISAPWPKLLAGAEA